MQNDPVVPHRHRWTGHPGQVLSEAMAKNGLSQKDLAKAVGLSDRQMSKIVCSGVPITIATALAFERVLAIDHRLLLCYAECWKFASGL